MITLINLVKVSGFVMYKMFNIHKLYVLPTECINVFCMDLAIISLYSINWLVFITETKCVFCAIRTGSLAILPQVFLVFLCLQANAAMVPTACFLCSPPDLNLRK